MSAVPRTKRARSRVGPAEPGTARRKDDSIQLHDEADLVNFRADAFTRFLENQDQLENVTSKPFHTDIIVPPTPFPAHVPKKYDAKASDDEVASVLAKLKPDELFVGDLRLMRAKQKQSAQDLAQAKEELQQQTPAHVLGDDYVSRKKAIERLAQLQGACSSAEAVAELSAAAREIEEAEQVSGGHYVFQQNPYTKHSVPVSELAPELEVARAPASYNPRSISSFVSMGNDGSYGPGMMLGDKMTEQLPFMENVAGDQFGDMMNGKQYRDGYGYEKEPGAGTPAQVNMEELNTFLAQPNEGMDEMDALMNFDQDQDNAIMDEGSFPDDFLTHMDGEME
ncbi:hypothetical protein A9F13_04g02233 [Clavispora lusitaniae]|uniref:Uncharacterized protein n=1 Tax=Clavispora lusitaniae TaxID=36911 RepID=A0AA91Q1U4_CLALS|nr:hypothetical protein A9F13_04g02233 [Clavispora lusitaniae]